MGMKRLKIQVMSLSGEISWAPKRVQKWLESRKRRPDCLFYGGLEVGLGEGFHARARAYAV